MLKSTAKVDSLKCQALALYLEGLGFRSIGRLLKINNVSVYHWIKKFGASTQAIKSNESIEVVELDELHTYVGDKKTAVGVWLAVDRFGKQFINFVLGKRDVKTCQKLWQRVENKYIAVVVSDYWKAYQKVIPTEKHIVSKAETYTIEGYNSILRHYLARLRRKGKCYSKSKKMLEISI